jgi:hypothetical protein
MTEQSTVLFSSPEAAGRWAKGLLIATLVLAVVAVMSGFLQIELLSRAAGGSSITDAEVAQNDSRQLLIGILQIWLWIGTAVAFLIWFHRMHKNLPSLGESDLKYTPGWAVGGFFVPFLNLVRPLQVMREVWRGSDPERLKLDVNSDGPGIRYQRGTPPLVGWWWALFLISAFAGNIAARLLLTENQPLPELQTASVLLVVSDLLDIPSSLVAISLVGRLTRWQAEKAELIRQQGGQVDVALMVSPQ